MLVMTAKIDKKKIAILLAAVVVAIAALAVLLGGGDHATATASTNVSNNDARVAFLKSFGWEVTTSPVQSGQVRVPQSANDVFARYNQLQQSQGYDLMQYAGKVIMRYVYQVNNYPGATQPVYATLLIYKNQIIGGDITETAAKGRIHGFKKPENLPGASSDATAPTTATQS